MKTKSIYNYLLNIQSPINNIDTLLTPILLASPFMEISKKQNYKKTTTRRNIYVLDQNTSWVENKQDVQTTCTLHTQAT